MRKTNGAVALLMAGILVISLGITVFTGTYRHQNEQQQRHITASFYPVFTAALQVTAGVKSVSVTCLAQPSTGCLHDYQMTPQDMMTLQQTDILILNGAGAEEFLTQPLKNYPDMTVIDSSKGLSFLAEEEHGVQGYNEHVWMSPARYARQIQAICDGLCAADAENAATYRHNAETYIQKINHVGEELKALTASLGIIDCVSFHESMAYLAEDLSLSVIGEVAIGEEESASAAELSALAKVIKDKRILFLYDSQYDRQYTYLADDAAKAVLLTLDTAVRPTDGVADKDAWLTAMEKNIAQMKGAGA